MAKGRLVLLAVLAVTMAFAAPAAVPAAPSDDFNAVFSDYQADGVITPCRFTRAQLVNARNNAPGDLTYYASFGDAVNGEIARYDRGGCGVTTTPPAGSNPAVKIFGKGARIKITKVKAKGSARREQVVIKNVGSVTIPLARLKLVTRSRRTVKLTRYSLRRGRSFRVVAGCYRKRRARVRRRATLYACRKRQLLSDKGDYVQLRRGSSVLSQRGFGRYRSVKRF